MRNFVQTGDVYSGMPRQRSARWNDDVYAFVQAYIQEHPCFYIQELQDELSKQFPDLKNISVSTICRALRHDLRITRKVLEKRARESIPEQLKEFYVKLRPVYSYPEQLVFIDESSKDGRDCLRRYGRSRVNTPAIVNQPFQRGSRGSIWLRLILQDSSLGRPRLTPSLVRNSIRLSFALYAHFYSHGQCREALSSSTMPKSICIENWRRLFTNAVRCSYTFHHIHLN